MFCQKCGNQIENNTKFCPHCGNKIINSGVGSITDTVKKATDTAVNLAQSAKNVANEAASGQAEKYVEKVKETAQSFVDDAKQVKDHNDFRNFLKKNNYRNLIIFIVLATIIGVLLGVFSGTDKGEKLAKNIVSASYSGSKIESVTKAAGNDKTQTYIYVVKFIPSGEDEHSALVYVELGSKAAVINKVYQKSHYDKLNKEIESWKMVFEMGSK